MSAIFHQVTHSYENNFSVRAKTVFTCGGGVRLPESVCKNLVSLCGWRTRSRKIRFSRADASVAHTRKKKSKKQNKNSEKNRNPSCRRSSSRRRRRSSSLSLLCGGGWERGATTGRTWGRPPSSSAPATSSSSVERRRHGESAGTAIVRLRSGHLLLLVGGEAPPLGWPASASTGTAGVRLRSSHLVVIVGGGGGG